MTWLVIALCLAVSFVFSGVEAGILSVNRVRLKHRLKMRDSAAVILDRLLNRPERLLVTVIVVTNFMNILAVMLATQEGVRVCGRWGYLLILAIGLPVYLIGLELLPKSLFRRFPYRALATLAGPLRIADSLLSPMHFAGSILPRLLFGSRPLERKKLFVGREDFKYLTIESERTGALGKVEREMIHNVVDFRAIKAREVMVPRPLVKTIDAQASIETLLERSRKEALDRWPVTSADGEIVGLSQVFDVALDGKQRGIVESYQRRIVKVAANDPAYTVLTKMRAARITLAVVLDTDGTQLGIVTWEDLIRRLVTTAKPVTTS